MSDIATTADVQSITKAAPAAPARALVSVPASGYPGATVKMTQAEADKWYAANPQATAEADDNQGDGNTELGGKGLGLELENKGLDVKTEDK